MNDALMYITICSLGGVLTLVIAAFCHGSVILASDFTLLEIVSPLVCKWHQIEVTDFDLWKLKTHPVLCGCVAILHFVLWQRAMAALLLFQI
jgi:hypothetical protein